MEGLLGNVNSAIEVRFHDFMEDFKIFNFFKVLMRGDASTEN